MADNKPECTDNIFKLPHYDLPDYTKSPLGIDITPNPLLFPPAIQPQAQIDRPITPNKQFNKSAYTLTSVDAITLIIAIVATFITSTVRHYRKIQVSDARRKVIIDLLNGSVLYPFLLLVFSPFNSDIFQYIESAKLAIALAGLVGLVFVAGEIIISCLRKAED